MAKRRSNQEWQALLEQYEISNITRLCCVIVNSRRIGAKIQNKTLR